MEEVLNNVELFSAINYSNWIIGMTLLIIYTIIFSILFKNYSLVASNRELFAGNFLYYSISIFLIITTIKSSLALSLGLVGALSIIRFRTAIKEPEQIIYLLGLTSISISLAAEQFLVSTITVIIFVFVSFFRKKRAEKTISFNTDYFLIEIINSDHNKVTQFIDFVSTLENANGMISYDNFKEKNYRLLFKLNNSDTSFLKEINSYIKTNNLSIESLKLSSSNT